MRRSTILPYISNVSCCHNCCYCIRDAKSKAVNQSKDRLKTEAKDKAIANHWNNAGTKTYANDAWWVVEDMKNEEMM